METQQPKKTRSKGKTLPGAGAPSGQMTQRGIPVTCPHCKTENLGDSRFCSNCASPLKESEPSSRTIKSSSFEIGRGDLFAGRYEIIESLGQGGMGKVYRAQDRKIGEVVALKLIRPEISVNDKAIDRFKNELKIARKITHRNICRMHDIGEEGFLHYITMEYVAGEDLKRFIRRAGTLSTGKAIHIAQQVCEGLAEAHRLGVIHRDLKPQNIMIDENGNAKIMDFGIARFVDTERMTGSGVMIGTPEYMSPEQAELLDVDRRADIYSLGVVLYEMVSGRVPFDGETPLSIAMKHKTEKPRNVRELNAQVPPALEGVIAKCLSKSPADRYQSAEELMAALGAIEKDLSTGERVVPKEKREAAAAKTPTKEITVTFQVRKLLVPAVAVVAVCAIGFGIYKFLPKKAAAVPAEETAVTTPVDSGLVTYAEKAPIEEQTPKIKTESPSIPPAASVDAKKQTAGAAVSKPKSPETQTPAPKNSGPSEAALASANLARARANAAMAQAGKEGIDSKAVFYKNGETKLQEGQKALDQKNPVEARAILSISEKLFRTGLEKGKDEDRLKSFRKYVESLREDVEDERKPPKGDKAFESGRESEKAGADFQSKKDVENALKSFVQAALSYQRILLTPVAAGK
ncbi:MAG: protein kinase domain-containing protein [Candidatus Aminicenantales bacterium]